MCVGLYIYRIYILYICVCVSQYRSLDGLNSSQWLFDLIMKLMETHSHPSPSLLESRGADVSAGSRSHDPPTTPR